VRFVHTLDAKDPDIPLFEACDEVRDGGLAEVHGRQVKHHRLADKKAGRAGERCVYFFKPACDRNDWAKDKRNVRSASHANQLMCRLRNCVHGARLALLFRMVKDGRTWLTVG
jgi:hypothetical protein